MIVKEINGFKIEKREHNGNVYYVALYVDGRWNKFCSLKKAVDFAKSF